MQEEIQETNVYGDVARFFIDKYFPAKSVSAPVATPVGTPTPEPVAAAPRKKKKAGKKKKKAAKKKAAKKKAAANGKAPTGTTSELDDHVESLLQAQDGMVQSRDLLPLLNGVNENRLRKSLARLVEQGRAAASGRTKSKQYQATRAAT